jgi:hypothetical protein
MVLAEKDWWRCEGAIEHVTQSFAVLATEDVLEFSAEHAAVEYAEGAGGEGRAEDGDIIRVSVRLLEEREPSADRADFRVRIKRFFRGTVEKSEART